MTTAGIDSAGAAFVAGLVTSLHCVGMCGPLACGILPVNAGGAGALAASSAYHLARVFAYTAVGALAGGLGAVPFEFLTGSPVRFLPWAAALFFLVVAFRLDRWAPRSAFAGAFVMRAGALARAAPGPLGGAVLGFATPLLPCGPFYLLVGVAMFSGSVGRGAEFMLAFALGTMPLLWLVQNRFGWLRRRVPPVWLGRIQRTTAIVAFLAIAWRLRGTLGAAGVAVAEVCH